MTSNLSIYHTCIDDINSRLGEYLARKMRVTLYTVLTITTLYTRGIRTGLAGFGGDYGEYLQLLKGNEVMDSFGGGGGGLDDVEEGQARQEAVMGGQDEELQDEFLRQLPYDKKKGKKDIHLHFDVNVLVLNKNLTSFENMEPKLGKEFKLMERNSNVGSEESVPKNDPFDWKSIQVTLDHCCQAKIMSRICFLPVTQRTRRRHQNQLSSIIVLKLGSDME